MYVPKIQSCYQGQNVIMFNLSHIDFICITLDISRISQVTNISFATPEVGDLYPYLPYLQLSVI